MFVGITDVTTLEAGTSVEEDNILGHSSPFVPILLRFLDGGEVIDSLDLSKPGICALSLSEPVRVHIGVTLRVTVDGVGVTIEVCLSPLSGVPALVDVLEVLEVLALDDVQVVLGLPEAFALLADEALGLHLATVQKTLHLARSVDHAVEVASEEASETGEEEGPEGNAQLAPLALLLDQVLDIRRLESESDLDLSTQALTAASI